MKKKDGSQQKFCWKKITSKITREKLKTTDTKTAKLHQMKFVTKPLKMEIIYRAATTATNFESKPEPKTKLLS